jgi:dUTP pyrophosphatase
MRGFTYVQPQFKKHEHSTPMPVKGTLFAAGYDFLSPIEFSLKPKEKKLIWTDLKAYMQLNECLIIQVRSSLGVKKDIVLANGFGVIDADYFGNLGNDGNIGICLKNTGNDTITIHKKEGIAQGIFINYLLSDNCNTGEERVGGFGSTNGQ